MQDSNPIVIDASAQSTELSLASQEHSSILLPSKSITEPLNATSLANSRTRSAVLSSSMALPPSLVMTLSSLDRDPRRLSFAPSEGSMGDSDRGSRSGCMNARRPSMGTLSMATSPGLSYSSTPSSLSEPDLDVESLMLDSPAHGKPRVQPSSPGTSHLSIEANSPAIEDDEDDLRPGLCEPLSIPFGVELAPAAMKARREREDQERNRSIINYAASIIRKEAAALLDLANRLSPNAPDISEHTMSTVMQAVRPAQVSEPTAAAQAFSDTLARISTMPAHGKVVFIGIGKSGLVARKTVATFCSLGIPAVYLSALTATHGDLGIISPLKTDPVVLISYSGKTAELHALLPILRTRASLLVACTSSKDSPLARCCDCFLDAALPEGEGEAGEFAHPTSPGQTHGLPAPTSSVMAALAVLDALGLAWARTQAGWHHEDAEQRDEQRITDKLRQMFVRYHPGGSLGSTLASTAPSDF
ncbi:uncharacterized protein L969DRAFT_299190 [Mixia osmundae IAM 14324]|uniref:SIS domain-containing protein n=1 Tax=Mixia osmundae (strain CBS 9802 / IAM 14324 / JCM 22182 / KY 12970) TaxID=764103 RepID=G7DXW2_MIXOS|nr:uncharacterized protein L969DRAFT_299190 [Mixia osmundae IAM 14324]KEI41325.1 hypothetical protein L969DRAFT_299190 [Mixia osmundae IAM 14324]GAA95422.1 hypothetical protein E5Q_02076 [Mixia osmundae IAM 14324]